MNDVPHNPAAARRAWHKLNAAGGVVRRADLQQRWGVTQQRIQQMTALKDFPAPCSPGRNALWLTADVEHWRRNYETRPAKPGPRPTTASPTEQATPDLVAAHQAWSALQRAGGVVSTPDLAAYWSITDSAARARTRHPDFPGQITSGRWLAADVNAWKPTRSKAAG